MKIVRLLIYEGTEEALEKHLSQCFIWPGKIFGSPNDVEIREIFRGEQKAEVTHLDEDDIPF